MLLIPCPWCGPRDEHEFSYGGEAHIARPAAPERLSDEQWADYLFMRSNRRGPHLERWMHAHGCRRWFNLARDTVTHEVFGAYRMGAKPPRAFVQASGTAAAVGARRRRRVGAPARRAKAGAAPEAAAAPAVDGGEGSR